MVWILKQITQMMDRNTGEIMVLYFIASIFFIFKVRRNPVLLSQWYYTFKIFFDHISSGLDWPTSLFTSSIQRFSK